MRIVLIGDVHVYRLWPRPWDLLSKRILGQITSLLGGRAAEKLVFSEYSAGAENDLKEATRLARRITDRLQHDLRKATLFAAPAYGKAALTLVHYDDHHHRVQYFNRDEKGRDIFTLQDARNADRVSLVRVEKLGDDKEKTTVVATSRLLDYVLFRRLGDRLVGVEVQIDPQRAGTAEESHTRFCSATALSRHFD